MDKSKQGKKNRQSGAAFELKDEIFHIFSTGFPKGMNIGKQIDDARNTNNTENTNNIKPTQLTL